MSMVNSWTSDKKPAGYIKSEKIYSSLVVVLARWLSITRVEICKIVTRPRTQVKGLVSCFSV